MTKALESETVTIKIVGNLGGLNYTAVEPETALTGNGTNHLGYLGFEPGEYSVK